MIIFFIHSLHFYTVVSDNGIWLFSFFRFFRFPKKIVWISLINIFVIYHLKIPIIDSLVFILHPSQILFLYFYFITFLIQSLLWRGKHQNTGLSIKRKWRKSRALEEISSKGVVDQSEGGNPTFLSSVLLSLWHNSTVSNQSSVC